MEVDDDQSGYPEHNVVANARAVVVDNVRVVVDDNVLAEK